VTTLPVPWREQCRGRDLICTRKCRGSLWCLYLLCNARSYPLLFCLPWLTSYCNRTATRLVQASTQRIKELSNNP
jgi:hypothetical protein